MNKKCNKTIYRLVILASLALGLLIIFTSSARANQLNKQAIEIEPGIYVFVSFSMNDQSLRAYFAEAQAHGAKLVMNGLVGDKNARNRFGATKEKMEKVRINVDINPNLFELLAIKQVPVIAVVTPDQTIKKISGHISLQKALELMDVPAATQGEKKA
jgi:conjugal transfer pilus assembly protein TrbC